LRRVFAERRSGLPVRGHRSVVTGEPIIANEIDALVIGEFVITRGAACASSATGSARSAGSSAHFASRQRWLLVPILLVLGRVRVHGCLHRYRHGAPARSDIGSRRHPTHAPMPSA